MQVFVFRKMIFVCIFVLQKTIQSPQKTLYKSFVILRLFSALRRLTQAVIHPP